MFKVDAGGGQDHLTKPQGPDAIFRHRPNQAACVRQIAATDHEQGDATRGAQHLRHGQGISGHHQRLVVDEFLCHQIRRGTGIQEESVSVLDQGRRAGRNPALGVDMEVDAQTELDFHTFPAAFGIRSAMHAARGAFRLQFLQVAADGSAISAQLL